MEYERIHKLQVYSDTAEVTFCLRCYQPTDERLDSFLSFLKDKGLKLDEVEIRKANEDAENKGDGKSSGDDSVEDTTSESLQPDNIPNMENTILVHEETEVSEANNNNIKLS
nr:PREDICTED: IQ domain-containing protein IQM3-like [Daucus carota subsp. sativus]